MPHARPAAGSCSEPMTARAEILPSTEEEHVKRLIERKYRFDLLFIRPIRALEGLFHPERRHEAVVILAITPVSLATTLGSGLRSCRARHGKHSVTRRHGDETVDPSYRYYRCRSGRWSAAVFLREGLRLGERRVPRNFRGRVARGTRDLLVFAPDAEGPWPVVVAFHGIEGPVRTWPDRDPTGSRGEPGVRPDLRDRHHHQEGVDQAAVDAECGYRFARSIAAEYGGTSISQ